MELIHHTSLIAQQITAPSFALFNYKRLSTGKASEGILQLIKTRSCGGSGFVRAVNVLKEERKTKLAFN